MTTLDLRNGDSRELLRTLPNNSVDSCVCDPPYDLTSIVKRFGGENAAECQEGTDGAYKRLSKGFMGQQWDGTGIAFDPSFWREVFRVLKPGAHLLACGGTRTFHRMAVAIEDAGFECRDCLFCWTYATGFPKSHDVSTAIDALAGAERTTIGSQTTHRLTKKPGGSGGAFIAEDAIGNITIPITAPATTDAVQWSGWGTALKPSVEPICCFRKPLSESSVARNVLRWGVGAINVDACRIETDGTPRTGSGSRSGNLGWGTGNTGGNSYSEGRWPANTILVCPCEGEHLPGCHVREMDEQSGITVSKQVIGARSGCNGGLAFGMDKQTGVVMPHDDSGGASRFFFVAKPSQRERGEGNIHPTVKPVTLLRYLIRLVTPKVGTTLDPFMGSGSAGIAAQWEGVNYIGFEREAPYYRIACDRCGQWENYRDDETPSAPLTKDRQLNIFEE